LSLVNGWAKGETSKKKQGQKVPPSKTEDGHPAQKWQQEKSKVKTRTLKTEGCGTPVRLTAKGLPPARACGGGKEDGERGIRN